MIEFATQMALLEFNADALIRKTKTYGQVFDNPFSLTESSDTLVLEV